MPDGPKVATKWGPSIGLFQVRSLRDPDIWAEEDKVRVAADLLNPLTNAVAAFVLSKHGTDWTKWSTFRSGAYMPFVGQNFIIKTGHPRAGDWSK